MAESLHARYMAASDAWRAHRKDCEPCTFPDTGRHCPDGAPLWERLVRLQNAYLTHLRNH
ncbi:hypothetical protein [Streptomyces sp. NPDC002785]|uniref:hypothetical protein n=1 Tax=Streptomyces sp. NPDC002785 TaxID=3154543 RepID=UPI00331EE468